MGFSNGRTGEKCLEPGIYNPEHKPDRRVNLMIVKGETFPTYDGNAETVWVKTHPLSVLREFLYSARN